MKIYIPTLRRLTPARSLREQSRHYLKQVNTPHLTNSGDPQRNEVKRPRIAV